MFAYIGCFKFQFLYGTIKTTYVKKRCTIFSEFQFLYGTIKTELTRHLSPGTTSISIPVWYD